MAKIWTKIIELFGGEVIKEGFDTTEKIVIARTKFVRFAKICITAIVIIFLGSALLVSIKAGDKETAKTILQFLFDYAENTQVKPSNKTLTAEFYY